MSSGRTGTRGSSRPVAARSADDDRGGRDDRRRLADSLHAVGRVRLGLLDELDDDGRHVERRRDQVVGEARVRDQAVARLDLLHQREPDALRGAALDLALDRERVDRLADVLRGADPDDAGEAELDVDLGDDAHRGHGEGDVGALARDLAGLGVERRGPRVAVDPLDVDLARADALALARAPRGRRAAPRPAAIHVIREADAEPAEPTRRGRARREHDVVGAELGARDLQDHVRHALADLGGGAVDLGASRRRRRTTRAAVKSSKPSE